MVSFKPHLVKGSGQQYGANALALKCVNHTKGAEVLAFVYRTFGITQRASPAGAEA